MFVVFDFKIEVLTFLKMLSYNYQIEKQENKMDLVTGLEPALKFFRFLF